MEIMSQDVSQIAEALSTFQGDVAPILKTLSAKVAPVKVTIPNDITVNKTPTDRQIIARNAWLGLK